MLKYIAVLSCVLVVAFAQGSSGGRGRRRVCEYSVENDRYSLYDGQSVYERRGEQCFECSCNNGEMACEFEDDEDCGRDNSRSRSRGTSRGSRGSRGRYACEYEGEELEDGESIDVDCNVCRCRRGKVTCTRRPCSGQRECRISCQNATNATSGPVCGPGAVTFPSRCVATCFGLNDSDLIDGPCSNRNPCMRFPCPEGSFCIARKPRCFFRRGDCQSIDQLRICVSFNVTKSPICDSPYDSDSNSDSDDDEEDDFTLPPTTAPPTTPPPTTAPPTTPPPEMEPTDPEVEIIEEIPGGDGFFIDEELEGEPLLEGGYDGVCGTDGYSYNSTCEMAKETGEVDVAYTGMCNQDRCQYRLVCGSDGETYENICELEGVEGERFDYDGECEDYDDYSDSNSNSNSNSDEDEDEDEDDEDDDDVCERVRRRGRCQSLGNCGDENAARPSTGCCPICGGVFTAAIEEDFASLLPDRLNDIGIVTAMIFRSRFLNNTIGNIARRCFIRGYFTRRYDYEVVLEAKDEEDAEFCFQVARQLRDIVNNVTTTNVVTSTDPADQPPVILSALTAATSGQSLAEENQLPAGSGAPSARLFSPLLLISVILLALYRHL